MIDDELLHEISIEVRRDYFCIGRGPYGDYAREVARKYFEAKGGPEMLKALVLLLEHSASPGDDLHILTREKYEAAKIALQKAGMDINELKAV